MTTIRKRRSLWRASFAAALLLATTIGLGTNAQSQQLEAAQRAGGDASVRLGRVEEQMIDLQAMVGTLESLVKDRPGVVLPQEAPQAGVSGVADLRIDALETQIQALTSQVEQVVTQMSALQARLESGEVAPPIAVPQPQEGALPQIDGEDFALRGGQIDPEEASAAFGALAISPEAERPDGFIDDQLATTPQQTGPQQISPWQAETEVTGAAPANVAAFGGEDAKSLYEQGYGNLLRQDYAGAEAAFAKVVESHPNDTVAQDAQFWLGESYFARGEYRKAADSFLKTYRSDEDGAKAPDALLRLGMSLVQLGENDTACTTFAELTRKYPKSSEQVQGRADEWRRRAGC
jgi:tol-pal system protein YbgF